MADTYMIIVADAADNVCGAKYFMWSHLASHDKQFSPHDKIVCNVEQFVMWSNDKLLRITNVEQFVIDSHDNCSI